MLKVEQARQGEIDDHTAKFGDRSQSGPAVRKIDAKLESVPLRKVLDHFGHAVKVSGIDHVGLGSDFDGADDSFLEGMEDISKIPNLVQGLMERGFSDADICKIFGRQHACDAGRAQRSNRIVHRKVRSGVFESERARIGILWRSIP
jgi:membrane dipeptidase (peptidase family M19)